MVNPVTSLDFNFFEALDAFKVQIFQGFLFMPYQRH